MEWLEQFFAQMDPLLRMFWYIAIPVSLVFIIQFIMMTIGFGGDSDLELEDNFDVGSESGLDNTGIGFDPFTIKNLINFLLGFSWGGISFYSVTGSDLVAILAAFSCGAVFVLAFFFILKQVHKLSEDNTFKIEKSIEREGDVYMLIPGNMEGIGKVIVNVNGSARELKAKSVFGQISPGTPIKVIGLDNEDTVIVEPIKLID